MVLMQEEMKGKFMHQKGFGKGQGFSHEAAQALTGGVVDTFNVIRVIPFGIVSIMLVSVQDILIALQMNCIKSALAISERDSPLKETGGGIIARGRAHRP